MSIEQFFLDKQAKRLARALVFRLKTLKWRMIVAESCTGGLLASLLTRIPGSSDVVEGGVVSYSNALKQQLLSVSVPTLNAYGAVSEETAREMVQGLEKYGHCPVAVSVTGIAGPGGASANKPVGLVWVAFSVQGKIVSQDFYSTGEREAIQFKTCIKVLQTLLNMLKNIE